MSSTVCLSADAMGYPAGGGHFWAYANWALSLEALGCRVIWMERVHPRMAAPQWRPQAELLISRLRELGSAARLALYVDAAGAPLAEAPEGVLSLTDAAGAADALISLRYGTGAEVVARFRRTALIDIDPGLLQVWIAQGQVQLPRYDLYFTMGENLSGPGSRVPPTEYEWRPCGPLVALDAWPVRPPAADAAFTTVTHWYADEWITDGGELYANDKRTGFLPYLDLPGRARAPLELALCLGDDAVERASLERRGWRIRDSAAVAGTPQGYREYVSRARGEFTCAKPGYVRLQTAWISDRSVCFLASGKPVVVQYTGPSGRLPDAAGLLRFRDPEGAVRALEEAHSDYARHSRLARQLAEEYFDGRKVAGGVLEALLDGSASRPRREQAEGEA